MLENTFCLMSGENKARGCFYEATREVQARECGEFAVNNPLPFVTFSIIIQNEDAVMSKTDCFQDCT